MPSVQRFHLPLAPACCFIASVVTLKSPYLGKRLAMPDMIRSDRILSTRVLLVQSNWTTAGALAGDFGLVKRKEGVMDRGGRVFMCMGSCAGELNILDSWWSMDRYSSCDGPSTITCATRTTLSSLCYKRPPPLPYIRYAPFPHILPRQFRHIHHAPHLQRLDIPLPQHTLGHVPARPLAVPERIVDAARAVEIDH